MDNNNKDLNEKVLWALSDRAADMVKKLKVEFDMDTDLALAILERIWPESWVYNLPEDEEE